MSKFTKKQLDYFTWRDRVMPNAFICRHHWLKDLDCEQIYKRVNGKLQGIMYCVCRKHKVLVECYKI